MFFKPYYLGCLAHASYLIAGSNGEAAVIDPRRDVDEYITDAAQHGLTIRHIIETHLHADFVSGHLELAERTGGTIYLGSGSGATFPHHPVQDGDSLVLGDLTLTFRTTPGHTPEGVTILAQYENEAEPRYAFTGDTLFIGDVGRPDLVGSKGLTAEAMARTLYQTLREKILPLPETIEIWPAHGAGSACGKRLSEERSATLGQQKRDNLPLRLALAGDEEGFVRYATEGLTPPPNYFFHDAQRNRQGAISVEQVLESAKPLSPEQVEEWNEEGIQVLDTRPKADFQAGHIPGSLHIQLEGNFAPWVGAILPPNAPLIVVVDPGTEREAMTRLARVGYEHILGWLAGGMQAWRERGGEIMRTQALEPKAAWERYQTESPFTILDVRSPAEWEAGHVEGAMTIPLPELEKRLSEIPPGPVAVLCGSGYRSSIAVSLLQRAGRRDLYDISGGWKEWQKQVPR